MISLDHQPERYAHSLMQLAHAGIQPLPFPATDVQCASPDALDMGVRRLGAREDGERAARRAHKAGQTVDEWWRETRVAQAIADSHRRALQAALARREEWTAIFEDDAVPQGDPDVWSAAFAEAWAALSPTVDLVRLGWCGTGPPYRSMFTDTKGGFRIATWIPKPPATDAGAKMHAHESDGGCTTGYIVRRSAAAELLSVFPCTQVVDSCFLWSLFMRDVDGREWGSRHMASIDTSLPEDGKQDGHSYVQRGVVRQAFELKSTRRALHHPLPDGPSPV